MEISFDDFFAAFEATYNRPPVAIILSKMEVGDDHLFDPKRSNVKIATLRANVSQYGSRHSKRFSVSVDHLTEAFRVTRTA